MSQHVKAAAWTHRSMLHSIAAAAARLLQWRPKPQRVPYDWREIERFRLDFERRKINGAVFIRFKIM